MKLEGKVSIVTGASSGIGESTAKILAKNGSKVVLAARRKERLKDLKDAIEKDGGEALVVETDVTDKSQVDNLVKETIDTFGQVDILINNAGIMPLSFFEKRKVEEWDKMIDVNIKGVLYNISAVLPHFIKQNSGHIVNISSVAGRRVFPGGGVYSATKFAVNAITEGLRQELSKRNNIKVTSIEPGATETELGDHITDDDIIKAWDERMSDVEFLQADDIAESILYACTQPKRANVVEIMVHPTQGN